MRRIAARAAEVRFVASTTVRRPAASRRSSVRWSAANAVLLTAWSASPAPIAARRPSEERTVSGGKWRAANVDLPAPAAPTSRTHDGSGIASSVIAAIIAPGC